MTKNKHAVALGRLGRAVNSEAQKQAARENGKKGGRPPSAKTLAARALAKGTRTPDA